VCYLAALYDVSIYQHYTYNLVYIRTKSSKLVLFKLMFSIT